MPIEQLTQIYFAYGVGIGIGLGITIGAIGMHWSYKKQKEVDRKVGMQYTIGKPPSEKKEIKSKEFLMDKNVILKIAGVAAIVGGSVCLFLSGTGQEATIAIVGGVFVLAGLIAALFVAKK